MASVSKTFAAVGDVSGTLSLPPGVGATIVITGTFVATLILESSINNGLAWSPRATYTATQTSTPLPVHPATAPYTIIYRVRCSAYTSGSPIATIADVPYPISVIKDKGQQAIQTVQSDGVVSPQETITRLIGSAEDTLTAHAGGTQAAALALAAVLCHRVSVCATDADSVALPPATVGQVHLVMNSGAASLQVFGTTPDTINDVATATGVAVGTGKAALFFCTTAGKWYMLLGA